MHPFTITFQLLQKEHNHFILLFLKMFSTCTQVLLWYIPLSACPTRNKVRSRCDWPSIIQVQYTLICSNLFILLLTRLFFLTGKFQFFPLRSKLADVTSSLSDQRHTLLDVIHLIVQLQKRWRRDHSRFVFCSVRSVFLHQHLCTL